MTMFGPGIGLGGAEAVLGGLGGYGLLALAIALPLRTGMLSLATPAFMAVGAASVLLLQHAAIPPLLAIVLAALAAALLALPIGLPLTMMGPTGVILASLVLVSLPQWLMMRFGSPLTATQRPVLAPMMVAGLMLLALLIALWLLHRVQGSRFGRAMQAVREDAMAAASNGIDVSGLRLAAFCASAGLAGLAGAFQAQIRGWDSVASAGLGQAVDVLGMALLGGVLLPTSPLLGVLLLALPELLLPELANWHILLSGGAMLLILRFRPAGLWQPEGANRTLSAW